MKKIASVILLAFLIPLIFSCSSGEDESLAVAKAFWQALEDQDIEKARSYATKETAASLKPNDNEEDKDVDIVFGEVTFEDGKSIVETTMRASDDETSMDIPLKTVLVKEEGEWKVDVNLTMMSMFGGAMGAMMDAMKEGFEEMGKAMADEMKSSFEGMSNSNDDD
ncbi:MAG: hypothetical protein GTO51_06470 [Candidatus Latescibacteria bacterium]|nr:hypothetical protein [Candidatus Latescibacterota bacterium]NIM21436.1 hypothetical protein [Candidatus Latescibacterota bacterium]NIM65617.1 hypothetical protein [Candidatus Latescibacterota bacterium]NIO01997.1 hypothetical protein [Candidatus Latescibacterota bacterium]NIO28809.1 hypothetical protein [Candidatus Latescibacterota bacterium]